MMVTIGSWHLWGRGSNVGFTKKREGWCGVLTDVTGSQSARPLKKLALLHLCLVVALSVPTKDGNLMVQLLLSYPPTTRAEHFDRTRVTTVILFPPQKGSNGKLGTSRIPSEGK